MRIKKSRYISRISCVLVATFMTANIYAQTSSRPKLVVGVMIEGLSLDQLDNLTPLFGEDGFKRLMSQGVTIDDIDYGANFDPATAAVMLYTGASPSASGIAAKSVFDPTLRRDISAFNDPKTKGVYTDLSLSPRNLAVSTLADEIRIHSDGVGMVHSIGLSPEVAIAMSGHAGNSAVWINDVNGSWATSSFYKDMPTVVQSRNHYQPLSVRLDTLAWTPSIAMSQYPNTPDHRRLYPFRITFPSKEVNRYKKFLSSAPVNREITQLAAEYIDKFHLGADDELDMLNLTYTLVEYPYAKDANTRVQHIDSYVHLDNDLAQLFKAIDKGPGMANTLIFIAGTPAPASGRRDDEKWNIPHGEFSVKRAQSLINAFLMAKFGNGDWVNSFNGSTVYLNRKLVDQRGLDIAELRRETAKFIAQMSGVTSTITLDDILSGITPDHGRTARRNVAVNSAADIYINLAPGWAVIDSQGEASNPSMATRLTSTTAPCFILYPNIVSQRVTSPVDARSIAPTVAGQLRIRSPNGAELPPLRFK